MFLLTLTQFINWLRLINKYITYLCWKRHETATSRLVRSVKVVCCVMLCVPGYSRSVTWSSSNSCHAGWFTATFRTSTTSSSSRGLKTPLALCLLSLSLRQMMTVMSAASSVSSWLVQIHHFCAVACYYKTLNVCVIHSFYSVNKKTKLKGADVITAIPHQQWELVIELSLNHLNLLLRFSLLLCCDVYNGGKIKATESFTSDVW